jgi:hypothetical protein
MKSILSLILPDNKGAKISRRYLKKGRRAIGFEDQQLVVVNSDGIETGIQCITADDFQEHTAAGSITKRVNRFNATPAISVAMPSPSGSLREVIVINFGSGTITLTGTILGGVGTPTQVLTTAPYAQFLSNGTSWYRVV